VWIAVCSDDRIAGTLAVAVTSQGEGHLRGMAVHPRFQRRGIATALLTAALNELRARGCRRVTLDTTDPLLGAVRFYESHGFQPTGRTSPFFGMDVHEYELSFE
jgi:ribosomal-protein-alanine N-acetyltransferase